jgi:tripartite-type tricarboxylate transporter receptor subunit TctC
MKFSRRTLLHMTSGAAALPAMSRIARAQGYPSRPVRLIVPFAAGGPTDILARLIGQWLSERLGQQFVIENRPGAGTNIGTQAVVNAPPDGYTLLMVSLSGAVNATLYDKLNFNLIRDIAPVAGLIRIPSVMEINLSLPVKTVPEFIAYAKANPGKINAASAGNGSAGHVNAELFNMLAGVNLVHVPYRGAAPALTDLLSGQVQAMFSDILSSLEHIRMGTLRPLAVTSARRSLALPDIPTVGEFVPGYEATTWFGVGTPRATPQPIIDSLNKEINAGLADSKMKVRIAEMNAMLLEGTPSDFGKLIVEETEKWGKVIRAANIKPE